MKVVLDTNIWVSAIIWGGLPDQILLLREQNKLTIAMSPELLDELECTFNPHSAPQTVTKGNYGDKKSKLA
ncbi:putative toxin-antitoxin system toxin component, PIN family [Sphaerospermopsis sp. LEGE 08334]|uniref:putative toxin-antitoxin system toxin component, PIN family n=1 Tax=Sphaerospermopsis sp. LEGE 08334 TaxID=1828651 RepID=UPI001882ABBA|nr:putative toxin-antitoxin system toxin component, PIN family [Sphaerospermopsis sp. LEGE 08334]MBE9059180.1 putative toxin-antitoxin system toxin component, PIN family [Sphaerospermopsis sp. LEGE 08334]